MIKQKIKSHIALLLITLISCTTKTASNQIESKNDSVLVNKNVTYPVRISLQEALSNIVDTIKLSSFIESIEYIPVKLKQNILLDDVTYNMYDEENERLIVADFYTLVILDRNGVFLNKVGNVGQGPKEYVQKGPLSIDSKNKKIYIKDGMTSYIKRYNYNGTYDKTMFRIDNHNYFIGDVFYNKNNFITVGMNYNYSAPLNSLSKFYGFGIMDTLGHMQETTPNWCTQLKNLDSERYVDFMFSFEITDCKDRKLMRYSGLSDTIYTVEDEHITPRYLLDYGEDKPDVNKIWSTDRNIQRESNYNSILIRESVFETERYFFTRFSKKGIKYIVFHDKYLNKTYSVINDKEEKLKENKIHYLRLGLYNDIDGGLDLFPWSISTKGNYWVACVDAYAFNVLLDDNHFSNHSDILYPEKMKELKDLLKNTNEEGDQIIVLMKLKKDAL